MDKGHVTVVEKPDGDKELSPPSTTCKQEETDLSEKGDDWSGKELNDAAVLVEEADVRKEDVVMVKVEKEKGRESGEGREGDGLIQTAPVDETDRLAEEGGKVVRAEGEGEVEKGSEGEGRGQEEEEERREVVSKNVGVDEQEGNKTEE